MKAGALSVGIVGGILALLIGIIGVAGADLFGSGELKFVSILIPIVALVGVGMVMSKPLVGGALMLVSAFAILAIVGFNFVGLLGGLPLGVAGALGIMASRQDLVPQTR